MKVPLDVPFVVSIVRFVPDPVVENVPNVKSGQFLSTITKPVPGVWLPVAQELTRMIPQPPVYRVIAPVLPVMRTQPIVQPVNLRAGPF